MLAGANFIDPCNLQSMAAQVPELGLLAFGVMLAMTAGNGGIDLSGIALANLSDIGALLLARSSISVDDAPTLFSWIFAGFALVIGLVGGLANGALIAFGRLTPLIATLGTQYVIRSFLLTFVGTTLFMNIPTALGFAQASAALVATGLGSDAGIRSFEETLAFMNETPRLPATPLR